MRAVLVAGLIPLLLAATAAEGGNDEPIAVLVKAEGEVQVAPEGGELHAGRVGDHLGAGYRVVPGADSRAVIVYRTGASQVVTEEATVRGDPAEEASGGGGEDMFSRTVGVLSRAADTDARNQPNRQGMIRPIPGQAVPIAPRNELPVSDARPTLTWFSVDGSEGYRIHLWDESGEMAAFETGADTVWTLPEDEAPLTPGANYEWTAAPLESGRLAERHAFRVAEEGTVADVRTDLERLEELGLDPETDGLFLAALIYRDHGLYYDAHRALSRLDESGDEMNQDALLLLGEILDVLGRLDDASEAFDRADGVAP